MKEAKTPVESFESVESRILCNALLNTILRCFPAPLGYGRWVLSGGVLAVIFFAPPFLVLILSGYPVSRFLGTPVFSGPLLSLLSVVVINRCYRLTTKKMREVLPLSGLGSRQVDSQFREWLRDVTNPYWQLLASGGIVAVVVSLTYVFRDNIVLGYEHNAATFLGWGLALFWLAQGGYWAVIATFATRFFATVESESISASPVYPSGSPVLRLVSHLISIYLRWVAAVLTIALGFFFAAHPELDSAGSLGLAAMMFSIYGITTWIFVYSQLNLRKAILRARERILEVLVGELDSLGRQLLTLETCDLERFRALCHWPG